MELNRRTFLVSLAASAASTLAGKSKADKWIEAGGIFNETFYLTEPLELDVPHGFTVWGCHFKKAVDFDGPPIILSSEGASYVIGNVFS